MTGTSLPLESWQYQLLWGGCCCHPEICALLGCWQSPAFPLWDPGSMWGRAGTSPIAFLAPSGRPSRLPAAEQLCQPEEGLVWGNKDQMPSLCTQSQASRAVGTAGLVPWSLGQGSGLSFPGAGDGGWQQGQCPSISLSFPAAPSSQNEVTLSHIAQV